MFTGIIHTTGSVLENTPTDTGARLVIKPASAPGSPTRGDSIAVNGVCLTLNQNPSNLALTFDVITETLEKTTLGSLRGGDRVNLEPALRAGQALDGHLVQGHVDTTTSVLSVNPSSEDHRITLRIPDACDDWLVPKGSITIDGVSLTIASISDDTFQVALIPTTLELTTLADLSPGDHANIECDILVKTIAHMFHKYNAR
ncbi:MAG: riboflavin synthase [Planctomycetota bacterium]|jgi:riboflavin synthase